MTANSNASALPDRAPGDRLPGLDGLRAIAVTGVLLYHAELPGWFEGGFLGVDIFFAISGFLITFLLAREFSQTGNIAIGAFYLRRARRLFPAALLVIACSGTAAVFFAPDALGRFQADLLASLLYVSNWWQIATDQSYFEIHGRPPLLQHLWSLAIEEQFYLAWPALALLALRWLGYRALSASALALSLGATGWMAWLSIRHGFPADADPSRAYLGTDTHSMGLLLGAAFGAWWASRPSASWPLNIQPTTLDLVGGGGVACLVASMLLVNESQGLLYRGGFLAVALVTVITIACAIDPRTFLSRFLSSSALRWLGERSYGLYLWHWPVFVLLRPGAELSSDPGLAFVARLLVTGALAELSWRCVEMPMRRAAYHQWAGVAKVGLAGAAGTLALVIGSLLIRPNAPTMIASDVAAAVLAPPALPGAQLATTTSDGTPLQTPPTLAPDGTHLLAIGDSVLLGARHHIEGTILGAHVDAEVGRQGKQGLDRLRTLKAEGAIAPLVLVHLGTNGYLNESHMRSLLQELSDRHKVLLMNVNVPRRWTRHNNELIARIQSDYSNVTVIDWESLSADRGDFFVSDGVHLSATGIRALTTAIQVASGLPSVTPHTRLALPAKRPNAVTPPAIPLSGPQVASVERAEPLSDDEPVLLSRDPSAESAVDPGDAQGGARPDATNSFTPMAGAATGRVSPSPLHDGCPPITASTGPKPLPSPAPSEVVAPSHCEDRPPARPDTSAAAATPLR